MMVRILVLFSLVAGAKSESKIVTAARRQDAIDIVALQAEMNIAEANERLMCAPGGSTKLCAISTKSTDEAKDRWKASLSPFAPFTDCETLWIEAQAYTLAARQSRKLADQPSIINAGDAKELQDLADFMNIANRRNAREFEDRASEAPQEFAKKKCRIE